MTLQTNRKCAASESRRTLNKRISGKGPLMRMQTLHNRLIKKLTKRWWFPLILQRVIKKFQQKCFLQQVVYAGFRSQVPFTGPVTLRLRELYVFGGKVEFERVKIYVENVIKTTYQSQTNSVMLFSREIGTWVISPGCWLFPRKIKEPWQFYCASVNRTTERATFSVFLWVKLNYNEKNKLIYRQGCLIELSIEHTSDHRSENSVKCYSMVS